jgi:hypothetical protein
MDYPGNSNKTSEEEPKTKATTPEEKKVERVTQSEVVRRKKPLGKRFTETFFGGDARGVFGYIALDVLIPAAKDTIADAFSQGIERMLFGETRSSSRRGGGRNHGPNGYVSYNRYGTTRPANNSPYGRDDREPRRDISRRSRAQHDFDEIIVNTRVEAEEVIDRLFDLVSRYDQATVSDLYEMVGINAQYTDNKWGWTDIRGAGVTRVRSGYLLDLPRPVPLD